MKPTKRRVGAASPAAPSGKTPPVDVAGPRPRPRALHWSAWAAALASLATAAWWAWGDTPAVLLPLLQGLDVVLAVFFAVEFFTRSGWRRSRLAYLRWRWFDAVAILPVVAFAGWVPPAVFWIVWACRAVRLVDRTLGDGFVQRKLFAVLGILEEEISDRVLIKMITRWERELDDARFGTVLSKAMGRNEDAVLARVFAEQLQGGTFSKLARFSGLQGALEREERRLFAALVEMLGSPEVNEAIRDALASSLRRSRQQLAGKDWSRALRGAPPSPAARAPRRTPGTTPHA